MESVSIFPSNDYVLARKSIEIVLIDGFCEAKRFLKPKRNDSSLLNVVGSFVDFLASVFSLDEIQVCEASRSLKETQKFCEHRKNQIRLNGEGCENLEFLMNEIFITDAELFIAILTILKQGITDYVKAGFLIRKAWKQYRKSYEKVVAIGGCFLPSLHGESCSLAMCEHIETNCVTNNVEKDDDNIEQTALREVQAAIAFGYGLFNLVVSFIPAKFLSLVQLLGFTGNQQLGLACLSFVCHSNDVKADLSRLGLLWFHAIVSPIYAMDDNEVIQSLQEASLLLQSLSCQLQISTVGLYFEGMLFRCKGNFQDATKKLTMVFEKPVSHQEILVFCDYEIGWCHLLDRKWDLAIDSFKRVKDRTVWSKCFYAYLIGLLLAVQGNFKDALVYIRYVPSLVKQKSSLGTFLIRKAKNFLAFNPLETECLLLLAEMIYLWECLPTCSLATHAWFLNGFQKSVREEYIALQSFLSGYVVQRLGHVSRSVEYFKSVTSQDIRSNNDRYLKTLAFYELGVTSVKMTQFEKAKEMFKKAKEVSGGYDFENRLKLKIDLCISRVSQKSDEMHVRGKEQ